MSEFVHDALVALARGLEIVGAGALLLGFTVATLQVLRNSQRLGANPAYERYRQSLGRVVLVGLEILVAATIIKTITIDPAPESLGLLALTIAIRTFLSWSTVLEMDGRWPWQRKAAATAHAD